MTVNHRQLLFFVLRRASFILILIICNINLYAEDPNNNQEIRKIISAGISYYNLSEHLKWPWVSIGIERMIKPYLGLRILGKYCYAKRNLRKIERIWIASYIYYDEELHDISIKMLGVLYSDDISLGLGPSFHYYRFNRNTDQPGALEWYGVYDDEKHDISPAVSLLVGFNLFEPVSFEVQGDLDFVGHISRRFIALGLTICW